MRPPMAVVAPGTRSGQRVIMLMSHYLYFRRGAPYRPPRQFNYLINYFLNLYL
jgi:hypothetical protein